MDRRSWPWKKKSSDKTITVVDCTGSSSACSAGNPNNKDDSKNKNYVKISVESYAHLTELEFQVKILNEKLSSAQSEVVTRDSLVKQHAKVAEEAVSGWEKAEAEALALKNQLESVTLLKVAAEDKAAHLDGALKECMRQIQNLKEEHKQQLHEIIVTKAKQLETVEFDLERKIADLKQELLVASTENTAISRSLQECSHRVVKITEEKSQADTEIEFLKTNIQSCEKEINSLKYELVMVSKELEIRNEDKNMSLRSAEAANKQNLENVKKLTKLEVECQRLRGLVRKKLPGPATLAQMRLEVENLGRDCGDNLLRRSPIKNSSQCQVYAPECSHNAIQHCQRETEFLSARLLAMEEETKMLKEALSNRNSELQASRNLCAETERKLRSMETQLQVENQKKSPLKFNSIPAESSMNWNASNPLSLTSMSEDGVEEGSQIESWAVAKISELSHFKKEKNADTSNKVNNSNHLDLMDDFLEMERLAHLSNESNKVVLCLNDSTPRGLENVEQNSLVAVNGRNLTTEQQSGLVSSTKIVSSLGSGPNLAQVKLAKVKSRIDVIVESQATEIDMAKILEELKSIAQDVEDILLHHSANFKFKDTHSACSAHNQNPAPEDIGETMDGAISAIHGSKLFTEDMKPIDSELARAVSEIHDYVVSIGEVAKAIQDKFPDNREFCQKVEEFSASYGEALCGQISLVDYVFRLSDVLAAVRKIGYHTLTEKENERESMSDCIDKVALPEQKVIQHDPSREENAGERIVVSSASSNLEMGPGFELKHTPFECSKEEFERLKLERDNMAMDLVRCNESLEHTKLQLQEMEQLLTELKTQLTSSQKANSLAETQLKCMAESYKSLENHAKELETELNLLNSRSKMLDNELQEEKHGHQGALAKCKDLEEQIKRMEKSSTCSNSSAEDVDIKTKQEREIAAAAEKLAECQETIFLLGRQLKALRASPAERMGIAISRRHQLSEDMLDKSPSVLSSRSMRSIQGLDQAEMDAVAASKHRIGSECPSFAYNVPLSPSDTEISSMASSPKTSKHQKQRPTMSTSPSSLTSTPEKHHHGFSRFFLRGKNAR